MKKYEKYRESGVEWLGLIPAHWLINKVARAFSAIGSGTTPEAGLDKYYQDGTINWVNTGDLTDGVLQSCQKKVTELALKECSALKIYPAGTVLVAMYGATIGKASLMQFDACTNQACCALTAGPTLLQKYAFYWFLANKQHIISLGYGGGQPNISQDTIRQLRIQTPPLPEQRTIAAYLDHKTAQLDTLLAQKETLLRLLHQKRQALINEAVTQGLDPAAPRKPSGVAWLGDVPAHWGVRRLKTLSTFITSGSRGWAEYYSDEGEVFLRIGNLSTSSIDLKLNNLKRVTPPEGAEGARTSVQENDLLISITALLGAIGVVPKEMQDAYVNQHIALVRLRLDMINPRWAAYFLISAIGQHQFRTLTNGGTKEGLTLGDIASLLLLYPPYAEQQAIVDSIEVKTSKINEAAAAIHTQIQTLKAYRQSLISEVVTGKVDVRTEAQGLAGTAPTPLPKAQGSPAAPPRPTAAGQLGLF